MVKFKAIEHENIDKNLLNVRLIEEKTHVQTHNIVQIVRLLKNKIIGKKTANRWGFKRFC